MFHVDCGAVSSVYLAFTLFMLSGKTEVEIGLADNASMEYALSNRYSLQRIAPRMLVSVIFAAAFVLAAYYGG